MTSASGGDPFILGTIDAVANVRTASIHSARNGETNPTRHSDNRRGVGSAGPIRSGVAPHPVCVRQDQGLGVDSSSLSGSIGNCGRRSFRRLQVASVPRLCSASDSFPCDFTQIHQATAMFTLTLRQTCTTVQKSRLKFATASAGYSILLLHRMKRLNNCMLKYF